MHFSDASFDPRLLRGRRVRAVPDGISQAFPERSRSALRKAS